MSSDNSVGTVASAIWHMAAVCEVDMTELAFVY